jgi:hypothetical protein
MLTASLIPAAFAASIVTCCVPAQDCAGLAIDASGHEILVNAYAFTTGYKRAPPGHGPTGAMSAAAPKTR